MEMHLWEGELVSDFPTHVPVAKSTSGRVWEQQKPLLFRDLNQETRFPLVLGPLRARGFRTYFMMPLTTAEKRLGAAVRFRITSVEPSRRISCFCWESRNWPRWRSKKR